MQRTTFRTWYTMMRMVLMKLFFQVTWDWVILGLTFYTVVMVPFNLAVYRTSYTSTGDITFMVVDSIVDIIFLIDIIFNFHTSFVGSDGAVIVDEAKIRSKLYNVSNTFSSFMM